ncbi:MAG TPA: hypothetical protein VFE24_03180 [Pirellulales bacterium]|jgi:hypothetical protein|nr:hypothetical protein [Pirellulales bacterium]
MARYVWLIGLTFCLIGVPPAALPSEPISAGPQAAPDLKDVLEKGLKARRPEEFDFVALVVTKVENGSLPRDLVESTFLWARRHPTNEFQYFEFAMRERAKKIGVTL